MSKSFGDLVEEIRIKNKINQSRMARNLGIGITTLTSIIHGERTGSDLFIDALCSTYSLDSVMRLKLLLFRHLDLEHVRDGCTNKGFTLGLSNKKVKPMKNSKSEMFKYVCEYLRQVRCETSADMAKNLKCDEISLCDMECGTGAITSEVIDNLCEVYNLDEDIKEQLQKTIHKVFIPMHISQSNIPKDDKKLALKFGDKFRFLRDEDKEAIDEILSKY